MKIRDLSYLENVDVSDELEGGIAVAFAFPVAAFASGPNSSGTAIGTVTSATTTLTFAPGPLGSVITIPSNTSFSGAGSISTSS